MLLSPLSLEKLTNIITGYAGLTSKINKSEIDKILEVSGSGDVICTYEECFSEDSDITNNPQYTSREFKLEKYVRLQLEKINGTSRIHDFIIVYFKHIYDYADEPEEVIEYLNRYFDADGYSVEKIESSDEYKIYSLDDCLVNYDCIFKETERGNYILINEHNEKCFNKIKSGDYSGAITNSRSLLEQLLCEIRAERLRAQSRRVSGYNGDIGQLVEETFPLISFQLGQVGGAQRAYEKLENGFKDLISGLAILRIGMSDAHSITYVPTQKDAILAVNTAKTLSNFIVKHYFEKFVNLS